MTSIKTYTATIKITFDILEKEKPLSIARDIVELLNGTRGANLYTYSAIEKLEEKINK